MGMKARVMYAVVELKVPTRSGMQLFAVANLRNVSDDVVAARVCVSLEAA